MLKKKYHKVFTSDIEQLYLKKWISPLNNYDENLRFYRLFQVQSKFDLGLYLQKCDSLTHLI